MRDVIFDISGRPVPASRPKVTKFSTYYPKAHTAYAEYLRQVLLTIPSFITDKPVEVRLLCVMPCYKGSDHPVYRADVDNLAKLPMDCMTKAQRFWKDDDLIVNLVAMKRFAREGEEPHTKVRIIDILGSVEDHVDSQFFK